jgi:hypothetical protein
MKKIILALGIALLAGALIYNFKIENLKLHVCADKYADLYKNRKLNVSIFFGYKDARPARFVADQYEKIQLIDRMLKQCGIGQKLCDFRWESSTDSYLKKIKVKAGYSVDVEFKIFSSSVSPDDDKNQTANYQLWVSESVKNQFKAHLRNADIVFYSGHSRSGGGPDFFPPLLSKTNMVKMDPYKESRDGLKHMVQSLKESGVNRLKLLGLFSCISETYFIDELSKAQPRLGFITSKDLLYQADSFRNLVNSAEAILEEKCEEEFNQSLNNQDPLRGSQIIKFF